MMSKKRNTTFHTVDEIAARLNESPKSVRRKLQAGEIPFYRFGKSIRIGNADFAAYTDTCRTEIDKK